jgi:hypothetical protein
METEIKNEANAKPTPAPAMGEYSDIKDAVTKTGGDREIRMLLAELTILRSFEERKIQKKDYAVVKVAVAEGSMVTKLTGIYHKIRIGEDEAENIVLSGNQTHPDVFIIARDSVLTELFR